MDEVVCDVMVDGCAYTCIYIYMLYAIYAIYGILTLNVYVINSLSSQVGAS